MRIGIFLCLGSASLSLAGCGAFSRDRDGPGTPGPPVPLKQVVMHDIQGLWGGEAIWIAEDRTATVQVVESGQKEKRYRTTITLEQWAEIERLVGANDFMRLKIKERTALPDEGHPIVLVIAKTDERAQARKLGEDKHPRFDALYGHLRGVCRTSEGRELIHEGRYDWNWCPTGFKPLW